MHCTKNLNITLRTLLFLCLTIFMLFSCSTMKTADNLTMGKTYSSDQLVSQSASVQTPIIATGENTITPETKSGKSLTRIKENTSTISQGSPTGKDKSTELKQRLNTDKIIAATKRLAEAEDEETDEHSFSDSNTALSGKPNDEKEKDAMEEALALLEESHKHWTEGDIDNALQLLDEAYVLLKDVNGNPEIARQKDDLRLMIAKKILAIYNSSQSPAKGIRGEIPLISNDDVEKEIRLFQTVERNYFISSYQRSMIYRPVISAAIKKSGLPEELSWLPLVESGFKINAMSSARALGLWQFIPSTGYKFGLGRDFWIDERLDFEKSTKAAIAYLSELHSMFGDWLTALAAYNCGEGRIMRTIASQHINYLDNFWDMYHRLPNETARYVPRFLATLLIIKNPQKYGFDLESDNNHSALSDYENVQTNRPMHLKDIALKLETSGKILHFLNAELRHKITPDKPYNLKVPQGTGQKLLQIVADIPDAKIPRVSYKTVRRAYIKHRVRNGESLWSIANKYHTSIAKIRAANKLSKKSVLYVKQTLKIPVSKKVYVTTKAKITLKKASFYKVKKGDNLSTVSNKYGISISALKSINNLKTDTIQIGQVLKIGTGGGSAKTNGTIYKVKKGDSLYTIARKNGVTLQKLLTLNKMSPADDIYPGQEIILN